MSHFIVISVVDVFDDRLVSRDLENVGAIPIVFVLCKDDLVDAKVQGQISVRDLIHLFTHIGL